MPPLMEQINHGNWLPQQDAEQLRDDLYYNNAIHAYITMLPGATPFTLNSPFGSVSMP